MNDPCQNNGTGGVKGPSVRRLSPDRRPATRDRAGRHRHPWQPVLPGRTARAVGPTGGKPKPRETREHDAWRELKEKPTIAPATGLRSGDRLDADDRRSVPADCQARAQPRAPAP